MGRFGKRFTAGILTGVLALLTPFTPLSGVMEVHAEQSAEEDWTGFQERLKSYGGTWNSPEYKEAVNDNMPQTALQGNGDTGIVSYGNAKEKTYLISKGDFRNGGDLVTSAPFSENDRSIRQIALGGVTIKKDSDKNKSLTMDPDVTVKASSTHDTFVPELAVNGIISPQEEAWASKAGEEPHWFEIDLGSTRNIAKYVMYHMGYAREDLPHFNTKEYKVSVSMDGEEWTEVDHVMDNTKSMTSCIFNEPVQARFVRIDFIQGQQNSNERARIAEFELFADAADESIFAPEESANKSLTQKPGVTIQASSNHDIFIPENAINGVISQEEEGWVSAPGGDNQWIKIDLGSEQIFQKYVMYHIGMSRTDLPHFNTKAYTVRVSKDDVSYQDVDTVSGNTKDYTQKIFDEPIQARYIMITFQEAQQTGAVSGQRARIAEFELFESPDDESIFMPEESGNFLEYQDISEADLTTNMEIDGVPLEMNNWLSATENTMVTSIVSNGDKTVALDAEAWTKSDGSANFHTNSAIAENGVWASRSTYNAAKENPESWTSEAVIFTKILGQKEFSAEKNTDASSSLKFILEPGETVYLVTTIGGGGQTYDCNDNLQTEEPLAQAEALAGQYAAQTDIEALREKHCQWWKDYWTKSYINIGDEEYHRYYYGSLYYMGCTARENKVAPGIYGLWVTGDRAKYNNDYHLNYNYMAPYYGMYSSNRLEGAYSLTQPILDYMPKAEEAAKNNIHDIKGDYSASRPELADGIDGAVIYPVGLTAWGHASWNADNGGKYISQTLNAPFAASIFISYYNYSLDEEFLIERAYPFVEKVAKFYEKWCEKEQKTDGTYQYNLYDGPHEGFFNKNAGVTIGVALNVYDFLIQNYDILKEKAGATEEQLIMWKDMYEHMAPVPVRSYEYGNFKKDVFALAEEGMILRPESASVELEFIHPGEQLSFDSDPNMLLTARNTVEAKEAANAGVWDNMNNNPKMFTQAIRAGYDASYVMEKFRKSNISIMNENFTIRDGHHGIEKVGAIEFINNMLLQSSNGILKVFPNWTGADAEFYQLREKGAYLVSSELSQGEVNYIDIVSEAGKPVTLVSPWKNISVSDSEGNIIDFTQGMTRNSDEPTISFTAIEGEEYRITGDNTEYADTAELEKAIEKANDVDRSLYTKETLDILDQMVNEAKNLLAGNPHAEDQESVNTAAQLLLDAMNNLTKYADISILKQCLDSVKKINKELYTEDSYGVVQKAVSIAEKLISDKVGESQQNDVDQAVTRLMDAVCELQIKKPQAIMKYADVRALSDAIKKADSLNRKEYTVSSLNSLDRIEEIAKNLISSKPEEHLQNVVNTVTASLNEAVKNLIKNPVLPGKNTCHIINGIEYKVLKSSSKNGTVSVTKAAKSSLTKVTIPSTIKINGFTFKVTEIGKNAFKGNKKLKTVTVGNYVSVINDLAFYNCRNLSKVTIGKGISTIGKKAFYKDKKLVSITIKSSRLKKVNKQAFNGISSKASIDVLNKKVKSYTQILKKSGLNSKIKIK